MIDVTDIDCREGDKVVDLVVAEASVEVDLEEEASGVLAAEVLVAVEPAEVGNETILNRYFKCRFFFTFLL